MPPSDFLNLGDLATTEVVEDAENGQYKVLALSRGAIAGCLHCLATEGIQRFGTVDQTIVDTPHHGKFCTIHVTRQRYRCTGCGRTFLHPLPDVHDRHQMTKRLVDYIQREGLRRTFKDVARTIGIDESTVRDIVNGVIAALQAKWQVVTPRVLGLDEIYLMGKSRGVVCNVEHRCVVDLLEKRDKDTILAYLDTLDRKTIEIATMDMWRPYRDAVATKIPKATVVVDKFHVVRMASTALELTRKSLHASLSVHHRRQLKRDRWVLNRHRGDLNSEEQEKLNGWRTAHPILGDGYDAKEAFYGIWACERRAEAEKAYDGWKAAIPASVADRFADTVRAVDNWRTEVFNHFEHRYTNAYTEALNGLVRHVDRAGRGYSFPVLRAKMLFCHGHKIVERRVVKNRPIVSSLPTFGGAPMGFISLPDPEVVVFRESLGVPISTLEDMAAQGVL